MARNDIDFRKLYRGVGRFRSGVSEWRNHWSTLSIRSVISSLFFEQTLRDDAKYRYAGRMGSRRYRAVRTTALSRMPSRRIVIVQQASRGDRAIAIINLILTTVLAGVALWLGSIYNANEEQNRARENAREDQRDAQTAQAQTATAVARCIQYNIELSRAQQFDRHPLFRIALTRQISDLSITCRHVGQPLNEEIVEAALNRVARVPDRSVGQAARQALNAIRRDRRSPPPTLRQRVDAIQAIGGTAYYLDRSELEIPSPPGDGSFGLRPSVFVDVGAVYRAGNSSNVPQSGQPSDRFYLGEPQIWGFDIRGVGPRVSRVPYPEIEGEAFNSGSGF